MCGILGYFSFKSELPEVAKFKKALSYLNHRGPDASSHREFENLTLGHTRLSIIDIGEQANQPFISECGRYVLIFNGEIYNFKELKTELIELGYNFKTNSDTEVLINLLIEFDTNSLDKILGMFSFAFVDLELDRKVIARDRLGIKPLYYFNNQDCLIFSSEIKPIINLSPSDVKLNEEALVSYLSFRYPILGDTFFDSINSFPSGHYMLIEKHSVSLHEYWSLDDSEDNIDPALSEDFYISKTEELLDSAVKYRMLSDVPLGAFLSGGVDSSAITALMAKNSESQVNTFTIGFEDKGYNEFEYAKEVAEQYKTNHKEINLGASEYLDAMKDLIEIKGAPLSVPNEVALYLMSKEMKKDITVVLSGEGADEIFGGYGRIFKAYYDYERLNLLKNKVDLTDNEKIFLNKIESKYGHTNFSSEVHHFIENYQYTNKLEKYNLFKNGSMLNLAEEKLDGKIKSVFNESSSNSYLGRMLYTFEKLHLPGLLQRVDNATMAASVEARVPFVDHRLVEFAFTIPTDLKIKWIDKSDVSSLISDEISEKFDIPKYILKKSCANLLSDNILYRKKLGFPVPLNHWFGGDFKEYAKDLLLDPSAKLLEYFNQDTIREMINSKDLLENHSAGLKLWNLINIELFLKIYFEEK